VVAEWPLSAKKSRGSDIRHKRQREVERVMLQRRRRDPDVAGIYFETTAVTQVLGRVGQGQPRLSVADALVAQDYSPVITSYGEMGGYRGIGGQARVLTCCSSCRRGTPIVPRGRQLVGDVTGKYRMKCGKDCMEINLASNNVGPTEPPPRCAAPPRRSRVSGTILL
jgi:hypothetical protein